MKAFFYILSVIRILSTGHAPIDKQPTKDENLYLKIPLEEMQKLHAEQKSSFDAIKTTIRAVLSAASLIISMVSALQIYTNRIAPEWAWFYGLGVALAIILYAALVIVCVMGLWPVHVKNPIDANWDILTTDYKELTEQEAIRKHLSTVLNAIELTMPLVTRYKRLSIIALVLLPLIVSILLLLTLIPRI